jgi:DNA-binding MarR family transcriptional regulator
MSKPFQDLEEEAILNLYRTTAALQQVFADLLRPESVTPAQYNVLRILRGAGGAGLSCREIASRMVAHDPDMTRLLDRMEKQELVERSRAEHDRRVVTTRIAEEGLRTLQDLDGRIRDFRLRVMSPLGEDRLRTLIALLEEARSAAGLPDPQPDGDGGPAPLS